ncbi:MAG: hypothetical protein V3T64_03330 [Myxococcota bacterium]
MKFSRGRRFEAWRVLFLALAFAALATQLACQSRRIQSQNLPAQPIALLYWEHKAESFRAESFKNASQLPPRPLNNVDSEAAQALEIRAYLQAEKNMMLSSRLARHSGHLMLYWPRTEKLERVEAAPANSRPLAWSPDHRRLLFVSAHRNSRDQLYEYDLERRDLLALTFGPAEHVRGDYDGRGRLVIQRIVRSRRRVAPLQTVHLATADGRIGREIARDVHPGTLRFGFEGDRVFYEQVRPRPRSDGPTVFESFVATRAVAEGSEEQILVRGREPSLTPDGQWIVFASPSSAGYRLRRMRPDGTLRVPIGPGGTGERMPTVSPDGAYVAFIQEVSGSRRLSVRGFDGKSERVLLTSGWAEFPVW